MPEHENGNQIDIAILTSRMNAGDEQAYRTFYEAYKARLYAYLFVLCHCSEENAKDALQETLFRVVRHIKSFRSEEAFWSWLAALARSAAVDMQRKRGRYWKLLDRFFKQKQIEMDVNSGSEAKLLDLLDEAMRCLTNEEVDLIRLRYEQRNSIEEISYHMDVSNKTIEYRLMLIRKKLKAILLKGVGHERSL